MDLSQLSALDVSYEESLLRDPYSLTHWLNYLEFKGTAPPIANRWIIYERALKVMPGSYKLWMKYLKERVSQTRTTSPASPVFEEINNIFERCLVHMHKMPLIWREYFAFLLPQHRLTRIRRTFDRALASLAVTQHEKFIWPTYLQWATTCGVVETGVRVYKRYLKINPLALEDYIRFLKKNGRLEEAAIQLANIVNDEKFISQRGKSKHDLWSELLRLLTRNPTKMSEAASLNVDAIIRSGLSRFAHEVGHLWNALAEYYIRLGQFEKARDIYEEAVQHVATVRDFSLVFDAYSKFEESLLNAKMKQVEEEGDAAAAEGKQNNDGAQYQSKYADTNLMLDWYSSGGVLSSSSDLFEVELDLSMARLDDLLARRPLLLSSVILRQNPHHVAEWMNRIQLFNGDPIKQIETYSEAIRAIDPFQANHGKLERLWNNFAKFYLQHDDLENARIIYAQATKVNFKHVDALVYLWCEWVEMELKMGFSEKAVETIKKALTVPKGLNRINLAWNNEAPSTSGGNVESKASSSSSLTRVYKSTRLWSLYADLEENFGTLETTKAVYEQMFYLKIVTPALVLNYASLMISHKFFEESFRIYEKGVAIFEYPHVYPIWINYLHHFMQRYGEKNGPALEEENANNAASKSTQPRKLERIRDLFEQALKSLPIASLETKKLFLLYAKYEEEHGLARRAMQIYQRAAESAIPEDRFELYIIYIARCAARFGLAKTREIYESAIRNLPDAHVKAMSLKYASLERSLGEIDRARAIYTYASQFCDPRLNTQSAFWNTWAEFEVHHGNQDTFKEMLRVKRSVLAHFAGMSIVAQSVNLPLQPKNSVLGKSRLPGEREKEQKAKSKQEEAAAKQQQQQQEAQESSSRVTGKRRREDEGDEEAEEEQMGAAARFAAAARAREQARAHPEEGGEEDMDAAPTSTSAAAAAAAAAAATHEEINIDDLEEDEEEDEKGEEDEIAVKPIPAAVFGLGDANTKK